MGVIMSVRGARHSEHAQDVSKWRPTMSLATECSQIGILEASIKHGTTDLRYKMESICSKKVRGQVSLELVSCPDPPTRERVCSAAKNSDFILILGFLSMKIT